MQTTSWKADNRSLCHLHDEDACDDLIFGAMHSWEFTDEIYSVTLSRNGLKELGVSKQTLSEGRRDQTNNLRVLP